MGIEEIIEEKPVEPDWKAEAEKARAEAEQAKADAEEAKRVAQTYKEEIEVKGLRKKSETVPQATEGDSQQRILDDYLSKRKDVLDKYKSDLTNLSKEDYDLVFPVIDQTFHRNVANNDFVATGEIERALTRVLGTLKTTADTKKAVEEARIKGNVDAQQLQSAEINGVKSVRKSVNSNVIDEDTKRAEETGRTPEREAEIRLAQEARRKEYAPEY